MSYKPWRDAASLIMFARNSCLKTQRTLMPKDSPTNFDYKLLMLKRSANSKFMPNAYVFPGGVSARTDFSKNWTKVFEKFGHRDYRDLIVNDNRARPFLMRSTGEDELQRDLAFRICALRETFEESGIFLHTSNKHGQKIPADELAVYRPQVYMEPENFIRMCVDFEVCPDIWSLNEHVTWLTPLGDHYGQKRFDTIFYTSFLDDYEAASLDENEIADVCWTDPQEILDESLNEKLWLAPPQVYELGMLKETRAFEDLRAKCVKKLTQGMTSWMPIFKKCSDCIMSILPGDELYPAKPDYEGKHPVEVESVKCTAEELNTRHPQCNRLAIYSKNNVKLFVSYIQQ